MRLGWVAPLVLACCIASPAARLAAESCYFSDLAWSEPGRVLRFQAGGAETPQTLELDVTTGAVVCVTPRCGEPSWDGVHRRVLWRDDFGVYSLDVERPGASARALVFLPQCSRQFLRALGSDSRGALLLWTRDGDSGEHRIWVRHGGEMQPLPASLDGNEMLRQWDQRNVATPFGHVGGQFVRSLCVQRAEERVCLEHFGQARRSGSPLFRLVLGGPKRLDIVVDRCVPTGVAPAADSSRVVLGLLEEIDGEGTSEVLSAWVADFERAIRVSESLLPRRVDANRRHRVWAFWTSRSELLWCDAGGQLLRISTRPATASRLVSSTASRRATLHWVVVLESQDAQVAEESRRALEAAGFPAAVGAGPEGLTVQTGVFLDANRARDRAEALRGLGFSQARVEQGDVDGVAPGLAVSELEGPGETRFLVRHRRQGADVLGEIWMQRGGEPEQLLLPAFDGTLPLGLVETGD